MCPWIFYFRNEKITKVSYPPRSFFFFVRGHVRRPQLGHSEEWWMMNEKDLEWFGRGKVGMLSQFVDGGTEERHKTAHLWYPMPRLRYESCISRTKVKSATPTLIFPACFSLLHLVVWIRAKMLMCSDLFFILGHRRFKSFGALDQCSLLGPRVLTILVGWCMWWLL
jgi:hypothetical protein